MKRKLLLICFLLAFLLENKASSIVVTDTISVNTTWSADTVYVGADIVIQDAATLTINAGTKVIFLDYYGITVQGQILAIGNSSNPIKFTKIDTVGFWQNGMQGGWAGIDFDNTPVTNLPSEFKYCNFEFSKTIATKNHGFDGGCFYFYNYSNVTIQNSSISNCRSAGNGGAIHLWNSNPSIQNCIIANNFADISGGAIYADNSASNITNNIIVNNSAMQGGGLYIIYSTLSLANNTICNNNSSSYGGGLYIDGMCNVINNILFYNMDYNGYNQATIWDGSSVEFNNCNVMDGINGIQATGAKWAWNGPFVDCINLDPAFYSPAAGSGYLYDGINANWHLNDYSPAINLGMDTMGLALPSTDMDGNPRIFNGNIDRVDIGAYEFQGEPSEINVMGTISEDTEWCGTVNVLGKVTVDAGVTLTICPGSIVRFATGTTFDYLNPDCGFIEVFGTIIANGNESSQIQFSDLNGGYWGGIICNNPNNTSKFNYVEFYNANGLFNYDGSTTLYGALNLYFGKAEVKNSYIRDNNYGIHSLYNSTLLCDSSTFEYNQIGIYSTSADTLNIFNSEFYENNKGVYVEISGLNIKNCDFGDHSNEAIYLFDNASKAVNIENSTFAYNYGKGMYLDNVDSARIVNCKMANNAGGIYLSEAVGNKFINCLVANNDLEGIYVDFPSSSLNNAFINSNIVNNEFAYSNDQELQFINCVIWGNSSIGFAGPTCIFENCDLQPDISQGGGACKSSNFSLEPGFVDPSYDYGTYGYGLDADWSLVPTSPLINMGITDTIGLNLPSTDLNGDLRIYNGAVNRIDIGAYEYQADAEAVYIMGHITQNTTWCAEEVFILGEVVVDTNVTLSICPGTNVLFLAGTSFGADKAGAAAGSTNCGYLQVYGTLIADGTAEQPINITSFGFDQYWGNIKFFNSSKNNTIKYCNIEYAHDLFMVDMAAINLDTLAELNIENSYISDNSSFGIYSKSSNLNVTNCIISYNQIGIRLENADSKIIGNLISNNEMGIDINMASPIILNNTVASNNNQGIAIYGDISDASEPILKNNILAFNMFADISTNDPYSLPNYAYNLFQNTSTVNGGTDGGGNLMLTDPLFVNNSNGNYRLANNSPCINAGTPDTTGLNLINFDMSNHTRIIDTIDMGAFEYQSIPLAGIYTIGGNNPDYESFSTAVEALHNFGVSNAVTFKVDPYDYTGSYNIPIEINPIVGVDVNKPVVFESSDSTYNAAIIAQTDTTMLKLNGADYITFKYIVWQSSFNINQPIIKLVNGASNNQIVNCNISGTTEGTPGLNGTLIYSFGGSNNYNKFAANSFYNGSNALLIEGINAVQNDSIIEISNNSFINQDIIAIGINYAQDPKILKNTINSSSNLGFTGIYLDYILNNILVDANQFSLNGVNINGIVLDNCHSTFANPGVIKNNMISLMGDWVSATDNSTFGIKTSFSEFQKIIFNTLGVFYTEDTSVVINIGENSNDFNIVNNIFYSKNSGYVFKRHANSTITFQDNNCYYADNGALPIFANYNNTEIGDLSALQSATGRDANSLEILPKFFNFSNLRINNDFDLDNKGYNLPGYTDFDVDGHGRHAICDIGADEFITLNLGPDVQPCNDVVVLSVPNKPGWSYQWSSNGDFLSASDLSTVALKIYKNVSYSGSITNNYYAAVTVTEPQGNNANDQINFDLQDNEYVGFSVDSIDNFTRHFHKFGTDGKLLWNFGDGTTAEDTDPMHVFAASGFYNVTLTLTDTINGCSAFYSGYVEIGTVADPCISSYYYNELTPKSFQFYADPIGNNLSYYWEFGDGTTSLVKNPLKDYLYSGIYRVKLTISNPLTNCLSAFEEYVYVDEYYIDCTSDFSFVTGNNNKEIVFNNNSIAATGTQYLWNFSDGNYATEASPIHQYTQNGYYNVCLLIYNPINECSNILCKNILVGDTSNICNVSFTYAIDTVQVKANSYPVSYKGAAFGDPAKGWKFRWDFGDGQYDSTNLAPVHNYAQPGLYLTHLHLENASSTCMSDYFDLINIYTGVDSLRCGFGYLIDTLGSKANSYPVSYKGAAFGDPARLTWNFGDGSIDSTTYDPTHIYSDSAVYNVCLTVSDPVMNHTHTACKQVNVGDLTATSIKSLDFTTNALTMTVFPNPAKTKVSIIIDLPKQSVTSLSICNAQGQIQSKIIDQFLPDGKQQFVVPTDYLMNGIYFIKLITDNGVINSKLIINK